MEEERGGVLFSLRRSVNIDVIALGILRSRHPPQADLVLLEGPPLSARDLVSLTHLVHLKDDHSLVIRALFLTASMVFQVSARRTGSNRAQAFLRQAKLLEVIPSKTALPAAGSIQLQPLLSRDPYSLPPAGRNDVTR